MDHSCAPVVSDQARSTPGQDATTVFGGHHVTVTLSGITPIGSYTYTPRRGSPTTTYYWPKIVATQTAPSALSCSATGIRDTTQGNLRLTPLSLSRTGTNLTSTNGANQTATTTATPGTWYFVANDENSYSDGTPTASWPATTCKLVGTATVDIYSSNMTVTYAVSN